jgi:hypothetical protein
MHLTLPVTAAHPPISVKNNHPFTVTIPVTLPVSADTPAVVRLTSAAGQSMMGQVDRIGESAELAFIATLPASGALNLNVQPQAEDERATAEEPALPEMPQLLLFEGEAAMYDNLSAVVEAAAPLDLNLELIAAGPVRQVYRAEATWRTYRLKGCVYAYSTGTVDIDLTVEQLGPSRKDTYLTVIKRLPKEESETVWTRYKGVAREVAESWRPFVRQNRMESWSRDAQWVYIGQSDLPGKAMLFGFTPSFTLLNEQTKQHETANDFLVNERVVHQANAVYVFSDITGTNDLTYVTQEFVTPPQGTISLLRWRYIPQAVNQEAVDQEFVTYAGYALRESGTDGIALQFGVDSVIFGSSHYPHAFLAEDFLYWRTNGPANLYTYLGEKWAEFKPEIDRDFKIINALGLEALGMAPMFERIYRYSAPDGVYLQPPKADLPSILRKRVEQLQQPGRWVLDFLDYTAELARQYGIKFVLDARISPIDAAYLVERYKDVISFYEVENEALLLKGVPVDSVHYWRSLYEAIKKANPDVRVFWNGGPSFQAAHNQLTNLGIGFDAVGVHEYVDRRESPDYVKDTALAHGWYASQLNKDALIGEFNWRYLARESEAAQAEHFYEIVDALLSQRSIDIFMQYKLSDTYSIQPEQQKGIRHYELLRLDRTLKPQGYKYLELVRKYGDPQAPINVLRITMPEISIEPDNWRTLTATLHNAGTQTLETLLTWDLPAEVEMRDVGPAGLHLEPGETATLSVQVRLKEGSRPGFYHLFLQTAVHGRILFGWSSAAYTAQPELDTQSAEFVGVKYVNGPAVLENVDFIRPGAIVLGDSTEELEWSYALYNTLRAATGNTLIDRVDAPDLGDRIKENLFVVGWCGGLAGKLLPAENMALKGNETIVYIGPNPYHSESKVVVFYGADPGRAVSDFIYRYWQFAKDAVTFDARIGPAIVDPAVVR